MAHAEKYLDTPAVVLKERPFKEYDVILICQTLHFGKRAVVAKGLKKSTSKLRGVLQLFSEVQLSLVQGKGLPVVTAAEPISFYLPVRNAYLPTNAALYCCDLIDVLSEEGQSLPELYHLLAETLALLASVAPLLAVFRFEWRLLEALGYGVETASCVRCGAPLRRGQGALSFDEDGALICGGCRAEATGRSPLLSAEAVSLLLFFAKGDAARLTHIHLSEAARLELSTYLGARIRAAAGQTVVSRGLFLALCGLPGH